MVWPLKDYPNAFFKFAQLVAKGFAKERACATEQKKNIKLLRDRVSALEEKAGSRDEDAQSALDALEKEIDYTPVVDTVAEGLITDPAVPTPVATFPIEGVSEAETVTAAEVAEAVVETATVQVAEEESIAIAEPEIKEVKDAAAEEVEGIGF